MFDQASGFPTLATDRLRLRQMTEADIPAVFAVFSDPVVRRYLTRVAMTTAAEARALIEGATAEFAAGTALRLGLVLAEDDQVIGTGNLLHFDWQSRRAEVGYALAQRHWGKGLATEAAAAMIDYGFETLDLHRIEAELDPRNGPSARVLERLGFAREGLLRERWIVDDEISDSLIMGLLRRDYRTRSGSPRVDLTSAGLNPNIGEVLYPIDSAANSK